MSFFEPWKKPGAWESLPAGIPVIFSLKKSSQRLILMVRARRSVINPMMTMTALNQATEGN